MPETPYDLIGRIINPGPRALPNPRPGLGVQPVVPLSALIGWTLGPPGGRLQVPAPPPPLEALQVPVRPQAPAGGSPVLKPLDP